MTWGGQKIYERGFWNRAADVRINEAAVLDVKEGEEFSDGHHEHSLAGLEDFIHSLVVCSRTTMRSVLTALERRSLWLGGPLFHIILIR